MVRFSARSALAAALAASVAMAAGSVAAAATTVDMSGYVNGDWARDQSFGAVPTGVVTHGGQTFQIASGPQGAGYDAFAGGDNTIRTNVFGATSVATLLNTFWGQSGPTSYLSVTFNGDGGAQQTFDLYGGVDVRDFLYGGYTTTINGASTTEWLSDGSRHLDARTFDLDPVFRTQTLTSIVFTDNGGFGFQRGVLTGVTISSADPTGGTGGIPEPAAWALMLLGFGGAGATLRRRRRASATGFSRGRR